MTLPVSGAISFNNINVELGVAGTTQASLGQSSYRTLAGVASGAISMSNFYGKSNRAAISYTFSSNTANASLNLSSISGYAAGTSDITVTINSGIYLYSTSTGGYGLNLSGGTTGDTLTIVNNGFILGQGGTGGGYPGPNTGYSGAPALNLGFGMSSCTINNTNGSAYIAGGGGGGGGSGFGAGGGGAGGGPGGVGSNGPYLSPGGPGGGIGASGSNGSAEAAYGFGYGGGGGGRILPGSGGPGTNGAAAYGGGAGGGASASGYYGEGYFTGNAGGGGGGWGASGGRGGYGTGSGGSGGSGSSAGANGDGASPSLLGGAGGKAVNTNGKSVTWTSGNTTRVYGAVS